MGTLNLSEGFIPFGDKHAVKYEKFVFSGGEPHIKIDKSSFDLLAGSQVAISIRINNFVDLGFLCLAVDAIRRLRLDIKIDAFIPYFPAARQDRAMVPGEPLSVKVYADIVNSLNLHNVTIFDPHSEVTPALLNNCRVLDNHRLVTNAIVSAKLRGFHLVSPDAGSNKKIKDLGKALSVSPNVESFDIINCDKTRNTKTGDLTGFKVYSDDLEGKSCIIVDDICDGGGTFIGLAEELEIKNAGNLYLVVSHGIFSKGFRELAKHFKQVFTTDSIVNNYAWDIPEIEKKSEIVQMFKFKDLW